MKTVQRNRLIASFAAVAASALALTGCVIGGPAPTPPDDSGSDTGATASDVPLNAAVGGVTFTSDGVATSDAEPDLGAPEDTDAIDVGMVFDPMCPHCATFEADYGETLNELVESGRITLTLYPVAFVAGEMSEAGANAFFAVAAYAPEAAWEFQQQMLATGLSQGGLDADTLKQLAAEAGADDPLVAEAIDSGSFQSYVQSQTGTLLGNEIPGTGVVVSGTPLLFADDVELSSTTFEGSADDAFAALEDQVANS